jgi:hypothetical protein
VVTARSDGWAEVGESIWADYLRALSLECAGSPIVLGTAHLAGEPFDSHSVWLPLHQIRYDPRLDTVELSLGGTTEAGPLLRCFVSAPRRILAGESRDSRSVLIVEQGGVETLVRLVGVAGEAAPLRRRDRLAGEPVQHCGWQA